jgi:hypothetical protein
MNTTLKTRLAIALGLSSAVLAGCGGGEAGAPLPPVAPLPPTAAPDTTPPAVTIATDISTPTATGPITFTFVFNEDVGISFDASDITISGAPAGTFTRLSGRQATLVVNPAAGTAGNATVSVAAGRFSDLAGNANTASATATLPYSIPNAAPKAVAYSSGFASANRTNEGGAVFSYSGSNLDGFNCTGGPAWCGSGQGGSGADSYYFAYYQTPSPATALYNGISVLAPGITAVSGTGDTGGIRISGQTGVRFTLNNNPEWQSSGANNFGVLLTLGKYYNTGTAAAPAACNIKLLSVVTPQNNGAATDYEIPFSQFQIIQACGSGISTVVAALASAPVSEIAFQAAGGTAALPTVNGKTTGANLSVKAGDVYPTTLALKGGITFTVTPEVSTINFSTGFASGTRTTEGGGVFSYSGSNLDGFNCAGGPAWCGSGQGGSGADSFYFAYYQTPSPASALYNGISVLAPNLATLSTTGDSPGVFLNGQKSINFGFNNNPEWQSSGTNNFGVLLTLGKYYNTGTASAPAACNIKLLAVVAPLNNGQQASYSIPLSDFQVIQNCGTGFSSTAAALASGPVSEVAFQAAGGSAALPAVGGKTTGANFTVKAGDVYPTTIALKGGISFKP